MPRSRPNAGGPAKLGFRPRRFRNFDGPHSGVRPGGRIAQVTGRTQFTDALLLRAIDYRDADRIVTLLTADYGKVSLLARGARRSRKRFGGALEPYCVIRAEVGFGRGELGRLAQASVQRTFLGILRELGKMQLAGAALELVRKSTPMREPDQRLFRTTVQVLATIDAELAREDLLLAFQTRVLALAGLAPQLDVCGQCGRRAPEGQAARFDPTLGAIMCRACGGGPLHLSGPTRARLRSAVGTAWAEQPHWTEREREQARRMLDAVRDQHLEHS